MRWPVGNNRRWDPEVKRSLVAWFGSRQNLPELEVESQFTHYFKDTRTYSAIVSAFYQMGGGRRKQNKRDLRQKKIVARKNEVQLAPQPVETSPSPLSLPQTASSPIAVSRSSICYPMSPENFRENQLPAQEPEKLGWSVHDRPTRSDSDGDRSSNVLGEEVVNGMLNVQGEFPSQNLYGESQPASAVESKSLRELSHVSDLPGQGELGDCNDRAPQNTNPVQPQESPVGFSRLSSEGQILPLHSELTLPDQRPKSPKLLNSAQLIAVNCPLSPTMHDRNTDWAATGAQHHRLPSFAEILNITPPPKSW